MLLRRWLLLSLCGLLLALPTIVFSAKVKMLPGSFLKEPAYTPQDLSRMIQQDKVVALRYSKHFGMSPEELAKYVETYTSAKNLTHSHRYVVFYIGKNGKITSRARLIKAGTRVLINWKGEPIMDLRCGNPFTKELPKRPAVAQKPQPPPATAQPVASQPVAQVEPAQPETVTAVPVETKVLDVPPAELPPPIPPQVITETKVTSFILPALVGAGAIGALSGGGGSSPVVPEPTSLVVLGLGTVSALYATRAMIHKSKRK